MKTSILIIAHNEEKYISQCIDSLLHQTQQPDEMILIAHNCTDKTVEIAQRYPITVIPYHGEPGIVSARLEGLKHVSGDIILCIDGDSVAENNWVEKMVLKLEEGNVLVGSYVKFTGTVFGAFSNILNKYIGISTNPIFYIWGASYAFWGKDKNLVARYLKESVGLSQQLKLSRNPDDNWVGLFMSLRGPIAVTDKTYVTQYTKETSSLSMIVRNIENNRNTWLIKKYLKRMLK